LPYLNINEKSFYQSDNGYTYSVDNNAEPFRIIDFPSEHTLIPDNNSDGYILQKPYGAKEYFSKEGFITKRIDEFGNSTNYLYDDGFISQITYSDGSFVVFEKVWDNKTIDVKYVKGEVVETIANFVFETDSFGSSKLLAIKDRNGEIRFTYITQNNTLLLNSYAVTNDYERTVIYDSSSNIPRIKSLVTNYKDGVTESRHYFYNSQNRLEKLVDGDFAEIIYNYAQDKDGSITINKTIKCNGKVSYSSETLNRMGQITKYERNGTTLELKYNKYNKVSEEIENGMSIYHSYSEQGKVSQVRYSNGDIIKFEYYPDGAIKKVSSGVREISYTPSGEILRSKSETVGDVKTDTGEDITLDAASGVYVIYNINNDVGVTNFHTYYGLPQSGFNCYTFAIGMYEDLCNPGYYSGRSLDLYSLSGIKLNVEKDQESLGRYIYDSTVNAPIPHHSWKIALRIRAGEDYHFMKISNSSDAAWQQKAGIGGPVMQLLGGKTPNSVTWDLYYYNRSTGKYAVYYSGFYNSSIHYMIIRD